MKALTHLIDTLLRADRQDHIERGEGEDLIKVHHMTSAVAFMYEKLRTFVDYKEEHLLRKNAIYRIIRRRFLGGENYEKIGENVIKELISARYLPNEAIPESQIQEVAAVIEKYSKLFNEVNELHGLKSALQIYDWIMGLAAIEIERTLVPTHKEGVFVKFLHQELVKRIEIVDEELTQEQKELLLYVAVNRSLIKSDKEMVNFLVLRLYYPQWSSSEYQSFLSQFAQNIFEFKEEVNWALDHPLASKLLKACQPFATQVSILREVMLADLQDHELTVDTRQELEERIKEICAQKYKQTRAKVRRSTTRAVIYILLTKVAIALLVEVPIDLWIYNTIEITSIAINIAFPPLLMFLISLSFKTPSSKNTDAMVEGIMSLLDGVVEEQLFIKKPRKRSWVTKTVFNGIYFLSFLVPFIAIVYVLRLIHFNPISIALFLFFVSIVSFFGLRIKYAAQELVVLKKKESLWSEIIDFFALPIVRFGRWLSLNFSKINVFVLIMDVLVEAPLKIVLQVLEDWMGFVKEKKEDI